MYRLRFETILQVFDIPEGTQLVLPLFEAASNREWIFAHAKRAQIIAEIPSVIWEGSLAGVRKAMSAIMEAGVTDFLCENIGAVELCRELGADAHGGMFLNVLNSAAAEEYSKLGAKDLTLSFEMPFNKQRAMLSKAVDIDVDLGIVIYGYLPLMKFRACPAMGREGCRGCTKDKYLKDRKGESFRILCHGSQYSELLNCVPLYVADKSIPDHSFLTLYFTVESREECEKVFEMVRRKEEPPFRRTAGLYNRDLL